MELRGTTILAVRHKGHVALIGDGQVTMGHARTHIHRRSRPYYRFPVRGD